MAEKLEFVCTVKDDDEGNEYTIAVWPGEYYCEIEVTDSEGYGCVFFFFFFFFFFFGCVWRCVVVCGGNPACFAPDTDTLPPTRVAVDARRLRDLARAQWWGIVDLFRWISSVAATVLLRLLSS